MIDRTCLSFWLRGYTEHNMLSHFEKALLQFPFSRLRPQAVLRVFALEFAEPALLEHVFGPGSEAGDIVQAAGEFTNPDCAYPLECYWDVLQPDGSEWKLLPAAVVITCFGPMFESEWGEQIQFEFGQDSPFLPQDRSAPALRASQENIRSLLRLAKLIEQHLPVDKKVLWNDSGESLAELLAGVLGQQPVE
jgi:hypothetical protein